MLRPGDVALHLPFVEAPQGGLEVGLRSHFPAKSEQFLAVRHAPILTRIAPLRGDTVGRDGTQVTVWPGWGGRAGPGRHAGVAGDPVLTDRWGAPDSTDTPH
ncbi:hypothetical protein GCM10027605_60370 [Micromonospora zhanjiangensis]